MGLFSSKSKSTSSTTNYEYNTSQSLGDLSTGNVQSAGDVTINGLWGEDMAGFLENVKDIANTASSSTSDLAGRAIQQVAAGYQSAYSPTTGALQQLKPVLMLALGIFALATAPKILKRL